MRSSFAVAVFGVVMIGSGSAFGAAYVRLLTNAQMNGTQVPSVLISGDTAYAEVQGTSGVAITQTPLSTGIATNFTSGSTITGILYDGASAFTSVDTGSFQIYRVDKASGVASVYQSAATTGAYVTSNGGTGTASFLASTIDPTSGELYFYDSKSKSVGKTAGANSLTTVLAPSKLSTYTLTGLAASPSGTLYFGDNKTAATRALYAYDGTSITSILTSTQITAVTGGSSAQFLGSGLYFAPDDRLYFYDNTSKDILSFDPTVGASSLSIVLTGAALSAGPEGASTVTGFTWYDGNIAWFVNTSQAAGGLYAVPEPGALAPLAGAGLLLARRRRAAV